MTLADRLRKQANTLSRMARYKTIDELASHYGVTTQTFKRTLSANPDLKALTETAIVDQVQELERILYDTVTGQWQATEKTEVVGKTQIRTKNDKPNIKGIMWLLCNLAPQKYKTDPTLHDLKHAEFDLRTKLADRIPQFNDLEPVLRVQLYDEIRGEIEGEIRGEIEGEIRGEIEGEIRGEIEGEIRGEIEGEIRGEIESEKGSKYAMGTGSKVNELMGK
jgi:phage tail protein X